MLHILPRPFFDL